ncbi:hypothetical protein [Williamsia serinedens]|uniref:Uncharacterized protein n=1 Tax=Williamsia serinedens TaxID=391736 RepID=A0ABT1H667_9NOCA|nr:hypothetical protein [Williamsia serinedens]MCP2162646.1 hypothetical protein [Williamsia serinedens]
MITSTGIALMLIGAFVTALVRVGYFRAKGYKVRILYIRRTDAAFTAGVVLITALSLVTIITTARNSAAGEECARQFRNALLYNAKLNQEQAGLSDDLEDELTKRRAAQDNLINTLGPDRVASPQSLTQYRVVVGQIEQRIDDIRERKMQAQRSRAPYPDPTCGRN